MLNSKRSAGARPAGNYPKAASENLVIQNTSDELLIYDLTKNRAICLNKTAALVWEYSDGKSDIKTITERVEVKLSAPVQEDLIIFALSQLKNQGLLIDAENLPNSFGELSRREAVKKIGFASMVALPIVSAIVAPKAAFAQSCVNPGGGAPGTTGTNPLNCAGTVAGCGNLCMDPANFTNGCCSGMGVLVQPGADCNLGSGCFCQCT